MIILHFWPFFKPLDPDPDPEDPWIRIQSGSGSETLVPCFGSVPSPKKRYKYVSIESFLWMLTIFPPCLACCAKLGLASPVFISAPLRHFLFHVNFGHWRTKPSSGFCKEKWRRRFNVIFGLGPLGNCVFLISFLGCFGSMVANQAAVSVGTDSKPASFTGALRGEPYCIE